MRYVLIAFSLYAVYRFLVGFLIPVIRTTVHVKKQFEAVRNNQPFANNYTQRTTEQHTENKKGRRPEAATQKKSSSNKTKDDYLDFEEIN